MFEMIMLHVNIIMLHFDINKWHVNIIKLIKCWLKSRMYGGQKYATVEFLSCTVSAWGGGGCTSIDLYACMNAFLKCWFHSVHTYLSDIWMQFWIRQTFDYILFLYIFSTLYVYFIRGLKTPWIFIAFFSSNET